MFMGRALFVLCIVFCFTVPARGVEVPPQPMAPASGETMTPQPASEWLNLSSPAENSELTSRRPTIEGEFTTKIVEGSLLLVLDGVDVTQLATVTGQGFSYKPVLVIPSGSHFLTISARGENGADLQKSVNFTTRHSELFEEAAANNELTVNYEGNLGRHNPQPNAPTSKVDGNIRSESRLKNKEWFASFATNIRYMDQNRPLISPLRKGFDLADWLLTVKYDLGKFSAQGNLGDVQVNETAYTVSGLARRGAVVSAAYDIFQLRLFNVKSQQIYGVRGGVGAGTGTDDHIIGLSGGVRLFDNRLETKVVYASGGEPGSSYNIGTVSAQSRGTVLGFLITSDFFQNMFRTELESAYSTFDPDTADEFDSKGSQAHRAKVGGAIGNYSYEAQYERIGKEFVSIGNLSGVQKDREGVSARGGFTLAPHTLSLIFSRYNDNITKDSLYARIYNYQGGIDYGNSWLPSFPFGISYQRGVQESTDEPAGSTPVDLETDTVTGRLGYMNGPLNVNFMTAWSYQHDKTPANSGTTSFTYTLTPAYTLQNFSVSGNFQLNQTIPHLTHDTTDTYTFNLDMRSKWFNERLAWDLAGTYTIANNDSSTVDSRNFTANMRIAYTIKNLFGFITPSVGLRGTYIRSIDHVNSSAGSEEYSLFAVLSAAIPFSL